MIINENVIELNEEIVNTKFGFVYITEHISKGKFYIGKKSFANNWRTYLGSGKYLKRAIDKYGKDDFKRHIVHISESDEESCEVEKELIIKYNAIDDEMFYNIHEGGSGGNTMLGYTDEQKEDYKNRMSEIIKLKMQDEEHRNKVIEGLKRTMSTDECRKNMSDAQIKRFSNPEEIERYRQKSKDIWESLSDEEKDRRISKLVEYNKSEDNRKRQSELWSGENNPKYGTTMSDETKKMLADARREVTSKKVHMYDKDWNYIRTFNSRAEVKVFLNTKGHTQLLKSIRSGNIYRGYHWKEDTN